MNIRLGIGSFAVCIIVLLCILQTEARTNSYWDSVGAILDGTNFYDVLDLHGDVTLSEIKKAFRKASKTYHPDHNPTPEAKEIYLVIIKAFGVLSNEDSKAEYDHLLTHGIPAHDRYYGRYAHAVGVPDHNPWIVYPAILIVATAVRHGMAWNHYRIMMRLVKQSQAYKSKRKQNMIDSGIDIKKIKKEMKEKKLKGEEVLPDDDDPFAPHIHIYGAENPTLWDLLPFSIFIGIYNKLKTWNDPPLSDIEQLRRHMELRDQQPYTLQDAQDEMDKMKARQERILNSNKYKTAVKYWKRTGKM